MTQAYPLQWPDHIPRTHNYQMEQSRFDVSQDKAQRHLMREVELLGGTNAVLSTNVPLRQDGLPYARYRAIDDTGAAIWFTYKKRQRSFACDRYLELWENIRALGKTIEAMRGIERWGAHEVIDQMFEGFTALPPPDAMTTPPPMAKQWFEVLEVSPTASVEVISAAYKAKARHASEADLYTLNAAKERALEVQT